MQEGRTKARSAQHLPEESLKTALDELTLKLEAKSLESTAAEEAKNLFQLERVCFTTTHTVDSSAGFMVLQKSNGL